MARIHYKGVTYEPREGETLLKMFIRQGVKVPWSCGGGSCHFCMHRCVEGTIPDQSQKTLRPVYKENRFFLLCCCVPESDMTIELPPRSQRFIQLEISSIEQEPDRIRLVLLPMTDINIRPGQFLKLLAGHEKIVGKVLPQESPDEIHLAVTDSPNNGASELVVGNTLEAQGPFNQPPPTIDMEEGIRRRYPEPDPILWEALQQGRLLSKLLAVFYHRIFRDPLLAPFFEGVTESRLVEKQYNFLCQAITGEKVYFGERPRNSHHWMVVSDELFDHRARILQDVLIEFGLSEDAQERLLEVEELYRQDIVKEKPWHKVLFGKPIPLEGYEPLVMDEASLCDSCETEIERGETITYHVRTGKIYCAKCRQ